MGKIIKRVREYKYLYIIRSAVFFVISMLFIIDGVKEREAGNGTSFAIKLVISICLFVIGMICIKEKNLNK